MYVMEISFFSVDSGAFGGLQRLKADIDPRYFWVSLRNDSSEAVKNFWDFLGFEVFEF